MTTLREQTIKMTATAPDEYIEKIFEFVKNLLIKPGVNPEEKRKEEIFARLDELFAREKPLTEEEKKIAHERAELQTIAGSA